MDVPIIKLEEVAGGALQEVVQEAMVEVAGNMMDPDTPWKAKRSVTVKMEFAQNEGRDYAQCSISVQKKLAEKKPVETRFFSGKDIRSGRLCMEECGSQIRGQMSFEDYATEETVDGVLVDTDTGEAMGKVTGFPKKELQG